MRTIRLICLDETKEDQLILNHSNNGVFTVKAYIELITTHHSHVVWKNLVWNPNVPFRINAFIWRVVNNAISCDANIKVRGLPLVSKCACCDHSNEETISHLLLQSECAIQVWKDFAQIFGKPFQYQSMTQLFNVWMNGWSLRSQAGKCALQVMCYIVWEIWKSRCKARFENIQMNTRHIIALVIKQVHAIQITQTPKRRPTSWEKIILDHLRIPIKAIIQKRGQWVAWSKPLGAGFKLNTDASIKESLNP